MDCNDYLSSSLPLPGSSTNGPNAISRHCQDTVFNTAMSTCLAARCESAPDATYGAEYATSICQRGGVDVKIILPEAYVASASGYFE